MQTYFDNIFFSHYNLNGWFTWFMNHTLSDLKSNSLTKDFPKKSKTPKKIVAPCCHLQVSFASNRLRGCPLERPALKAWATGFKVSGEVILGHRWKSELVWLNIEQFLFLSLFCFRQLLKIPERKTLTQCLKFTIRSNFFKIF